MVKLLRKKHAAWLIIDCLKKSTRPLSTGLSEISETSHEPNSTQESESIDLADVESRDITQYDDDSDRAGSKTYDFLITSHNGGFSLNLIVSKNFLKLIFRMVLIILKLFH